MRTFVCRRPIHCSALNSWACRVTCICNCLHTDIRITTMIVFKRQKTSSMGYQWFFIYVISITTSYLQNIYALLPFTYPGQWTISCTLPVPIPSRQRPRYQCKRYMSHSIQKGMRETENRIKTPKPCGMRCALKMEDGQNIKLVCSSLIRHTNTWIRPVLVYCILRYIFRFHLHTVTRCVSDGGFELSGF